MTRHEFSAPIEQAKSGGAYVVIPFDVEKTFGKKRVPVAATIDGMPYRGSIVPGMGGMGCHVLGVLKEIRNATGKDIGDTVTVVVEEDSAPREVIVPDDLKSALASDATAHEFFSTLSYSRQREFVLWVEGAKREETRSARVAASVEKLAAHEKLR